MHLPAPAQKSGNLLFRNGQLQDSQVGTTLALLQLGKILFDWQQESRKLQLLFTMMKIFVFSLVSFYELLIVFIFYFSFYPVLRLNTWRLLIWRIGDILSTIEEQVFVSFKEKREIFLLQKKDRKRIYWSRWSKYIFSSPTCLPISLWCSNLDNVINEKEHVVPIMFYVEVSYPGDTF